MTRNIIIAILTLTCVLIIFFGYIKSNEAQKLSEYSMEQYSKSRELEKKMNQRLEELELSLDSVQNQLKKCQSGE